MNKEIKLYAVYKGEEFIDVGTRDELCERLGMKRETFNFFKAPSYLKRIEHLKNAKMIIQLENEERENETN